MTALAIGPASATALLGVAAAVVVWVLRFAIRRRRTHAGRGTADRARGFDAGEDGSTFERREGSAAPDVAIRIPLPGRGRPSLAVRHVQLHATELGLVAGGLLAWLASLAVVDPLVGALLGAAMGVVSFWRVRQMAVPTVRRATVPWLGATVLGCGIGTLLFF